MRLQLNLYPLTLYYDGACPLCRAEMQNLMLRNQRERRLRFVDIAEPGFQPPDDVTTNDLTRLLHAQAPDGRWLTGIDAFVAMYEAVGLSWVAQALGAPGLRHVADRLYPWVARHRHRFPRWLAHLVFETAMRRAALQATPACSRGVCQKDGT